MDPTRGETAVRPLMLARETAQGTAARKKGTTLPLRAVHVSWEDGPALLVSHPCATAEQARNLYAAIHDNPVLPTGTFFPFLLPHWEHLQLYHYRAFWNQGLLKL